jgi:hypothetical protein
MQCDPKLQSGIKYHSVTQAIFRELVHNKNANCTVQWIRCSIMFIASTEIKAHTLEKELSDPEGLGFLIIYYLSFCSVVSLLLWKFYEDFPERVINVQIIKE